MRPGNFPAPRACYRDSAVYREMSASPLWVCEPKLDGYRARTGGGWILSRAGKRLATWDCPVVCDGEWIRGQGFTAFDLLRWQAWETGALPYGRRRMALEAAAARHGFDIVPLLRDDDPLPGALAAGHEGIVFKRIDQPYPTGATPWWVKCKG